MQCSVLERDLTDGNIVKMVNSNKNTSKKDFNLVNQQCTRYQDITGQGSKLRVGMPTCSVDQTEAVRRYYAAFPALKKGQESPLQYYLPPPAWCRKTDTDQKINMQSELSMITKDWNSKKKFFTGKERRNSYHGQRKNNKKRCNSYSRSFESKESLPEWVTHEGVWDMETQDPVKEFIRAIALDEGYGTCENTVTDELKEISQVKFRLNENMVPAWDDSLDLGAEWVITDDLNPRVRTPMEEELYAKFEAKFDRSIEALWKDQNTPDDEYQDLPIDFQDLLSSPSDNLFADPCAEKSMMSLTESIWSNASERESPSRLAEALHDRLKPLQLAEPEPEPEPVDPFVLYEGDDIYDAAENVACTMRSLTAINHSRDRSGFVEVPPRRRARVERPAPAPCASPPRVAEDLLTSARTHFRPIDRDDTRYNDGDCFDIRGDLDQVQFHRSESGGVYIEGSKERYLEYREEKSIDYTRLRLTEAQRCPDLDDDAFRLRFPLRQQDAGVQTDRTELWCEECGGSAKKKRPSAMESIWSCASVPACDACPVTEPVPRPALAPDELTRDWEELLSDISAAHLGSAGAGAGPGSGPGAGPAAPEPPDRKRRHSAALRCAAACSHPHARFLACCELLDRPLTR